MTIQDELSIDRVRLEDGEDCDCDACGTPLFPGEVAWRDDVTFSVGCCLPCCRDAARQKLVTFADEPLRQRQLF